MAEKLNVANTNFHDDEYVQLSDEFEQIRTCIGMYISYRGTKAAIHLFKEIFNNALDECVNPNSPADIVKVYFDEALGEIMISDNGRGIPFEVMKATITEKQDKLYVTYYNLEAVIFLSFRINTYCTKLFREWVLNSLCEYKRLKEKQPEVLVVFNASDHFIQLSNRKYGYKQIADRKVDNGAEKTSAVRHPRTDGA